MLGDLNIEFGEIPYTVEAEYLSCGEIDPKYRASILRDMMDLAAQCYISADYWKVFNATIANYPHLDPLNIKEDGSIENALFMLFDEGFSCDTFEIALETVSTKELLNTAEYVEMAKIFYEAVMERANQFKAKYGSFFEAAFEQNPYSPKYAFIIAVMSANLPLDEWADEWPSFILDKIGYLIEGALLREAQREHAA
jgi:hypothetical protein